MDLQFQKHSGAPVAAGMMYIRQLKLKPFENSKETAEFILKINNMFDILHSKSEFVKPNHFRHNIDEFKLYLNETMFYLKGVKDGNEIKPTIKPIDWPIKHLL